MIICPNCKHEEIEGAIFCSECGTQLVRSDAGTTQQIASEDADKIPTSPLDSGLPNPNNVWISLHMLDSGQILPISERNEFTMGRISDSQPIMPDIDLSSFKAYDNGVSRLHAVIRRNSGSVIVMDLGSSNGTYVNGARLVPNLEQPLRHGDIVALGKLKMQVVLL
jgi:pSer/pThr/pTyr-binding forkhead associated (FHA) protein